MRRVVTVSCLASVFLAGASAWAQPSTHQQEVERCMQQPVTYPPYGDPFVQNGKHFQGARHEMWACPETKSWSKECWPRVRWALPDVKALAKRVKEINDQRNLDPSCVVKDSGGTCTLGDPNPEDVRQVTFWCAGGRKACLDAIEGAEHALACANVENACDVHSERAASRREECERKISEAEREAAQREEQQRARQEEERRRQEQQQAQVEANRQAAEKQRAAREAAAQARQEQRTEEVQAAMDRAKRNLEATGKPADGPSSPEVPDTSSQTGDSGVAAAGAQMIGAFASAGGDLANETGFEDQPGQFEMVGLLGMFNNEDLDMVQTGLGLGMGIRRRFATHVTGGGLAYGPELAVRGTAQVLIHDSVDPADQQRGSFDGNKLVADASLLFWLGHVGAGFYSSARYVSFGGTDIMGQEHRATYQAVFGGPELRILLAEQEPGALGANGGVELFGRWLTMQLSGFSTGFHLGIGGLLMTVEVERVAPMSTFGLDMTIGFRRPWGSR